MIHTNAAHLNGFSGVGDDAENTLPKRVVTCSYGCKAAPKKLGWQEEPTELSYRKCVLLREFVTRAGD